MWSVVRAPHHNFHWNLLSEKFQKYQRKYENPENFTILLFDPYYYNIIIN